ncbi:RGCVC family protein [Rhodococcus sp. MTM3W5.2]|uniref:RGCVC family protein n=1 Tax=Rhodococcus sp. MTM3W5.2 TaxID=1805827 RepID=UPI001CB93D2E|nr:RGCVC family protein [Rhodococcus sp. MTM3W5.2]
MASNPTDVSNPQTDSASPSPDQAFESSPSCPVCPHSLDSHDALGTRFCAATSDRHLERKCICAGEQVIGHHYTRY